MWASDMALQKSEESMNFNLDREPRRHLNADFKIEKEKRQRMKLTVVLYGRWNFSECKSANRLINRVDTGPIVHGGQKIEMAQKIHASRG